MDSIFLISSVMAIAGAMLMVTRTNAVHGLLFLLISFGGSAGVFYTLDATFLAVSQVLVYAGAISVLFLFVLMFVDLRRRGEDVLPIRVGSLSVYDPGAVQEVRVEERESFEFSLGAAVFAAVLFGIFGAVIWDLPASYDSFDRIGTFHEVNQAQQFGSIKQIGIVSIERYPLHFEIVGFVVLVGVMGAVVLAKKAAGVSDAPAAPSAPSKGHH